MFGVPKQFDPVCAQGTHVPELGSQASPEQHWAVVVQKSPTWLHAPCEPSIASERPPSPASPPPLLWLPPIRSSSDGATSEQCTRLAATKTEAIARGSP